MPTTYVKIDWPHYQKFQDEDWFDEEVFVAPSEKPIYPCAFIPEERWNAMLPDPDTAIDTGAIHESDADEDHHSV